MTTLKTKLWKAYWTVKMVEDQPMTMAVFAACGVTLGLAMWRVAPIF